MRVRTLFQLVDRVKLSEGRSWHCGCLEMSDGFHRGLATNVERARNMISGRGGYGRHQSDEGDQAEDEDSGEGQHTRSCVGRRDGVYRTAGNFSELPIAKDKRGLSRDKTQ